MLNLQALRVRYGTQTVLDRVSLAVAEGEWLMIVGPNGAGKSTLLNAVAQGVPYTGQVLLGGRDARRMRPRERARWMGTLSQTHRVGYAFTVAEVVRLGRYAYTGAFSGMRPADEAAVAEALRFTGMEPFAGHSVLTLSGGELQRAFLAQVIAQDPRLLLLDEPTNHLDLKFQKQVFDLIRQWLRTPGRAAVSVVHDLSLAMAYGTHALLLQGGRALASGPVAATLSQAHLTEAYGMDVYGWLQTLLAPWATQGAPPAGQAVPSSLAPDV